MRRVSLLGAMLAASVTAAGLGYSSSAVAQGPGSQQGYGWGMGYGPGMHGYGQGYGPGMMMGPGYGPGMMGPGYGPGMMMGPGYGPGMMGPGYGPGMMGPGYGPGMMMGPGYGPGRGYGQGRQADLNLSPSDVKTYLERWIAFQGNPRLKVGEVKEKDANTIQADIVTKEGNALVQRFVVDRHTGFYRPSAS